MSHNDQRTSTSVWQSIDKETLMPNQPNVREIAQNLFELVADLPIISPHGHVSPQMLFENSAFSNAADLFIHHNHYVTRLLFADDAPMEEILSAEKSGVDASSEQQGRKAWQHFANRQHLFAGTATGYWFKREMSSVFGIDTELNSTNAPEIYDAIARKLTEQQMLPHSLFKKFNIEFLATTDSPEDDLQFHKKLASLDLGGRVAPTMRPDRYLEPLSANWLSLVESITTLTGEQFSQAGLVNAIAKRREYFIQNGAVSIDIGAETAFTTILETSEAQRLFEKAAKSTLTPEEALAYRGHMIAEMIRLSCEDGLVVTLHVGVKRNHSGPTHEKFGADTGHDIPIAAEFTNNVQPVLELYGLNTNLQLILFALDETTWSREIAPLAGFYPSVYIGAPWWFFDAPESGRRFRAATVETAGFYRGSGFIDDTRAFLSITTRHDMARRVDSAFLAEMVADNRLTLSQAQKIAVDLVTTIPKKAFKL